MKKEFDQDALLSQAEVSEKKRREELSDIEVNEADQAGDAIALSDDQLEAEAVVADAGSIATDASAAVSGVSGISTTALVGGSLAAIGAGLALSGGSSSSDVEREEAPKPAPRTEPVSNDETVTVSAAEVTEFINQNSSNEAFAIQLTGTGSNTLNLENGNVAPQQGFVISSAGNLVINAENASGDIVVNTTKSVTANLGGGVENITTGLGDDRIILAANSLGAGDEINGGLGADTLVLSGDESNRVGGSDGAELSGIEKIELNSLVEFASLEDIEGIAVQGNGVDSKVIINTSNNDAIDLSDLSLLELATLELTVDASASGDVTVELNAESAASLGQLVVTASDADFPVSAITIVGDAEAVKALVVGDKVAGDLTPAFKIEDSAENIEALISDAEFAAAVKEAGISVEAGAVSVADALQLLASETNLAYTLKDTAEALALAPRKVFAGTDSLQTTVVELTTPATAAQIVSIASNSQLTSGVVFGLEDTASNLANYADTALTPSAITVTDTATVAEAVAIRELLAAATSPIADDIETSIVVSGTLIQIADTIVVEDLTQDPVVEAESTLDIASKIIIENTSVALTDLTPVVEAYDSIEPVIATATAAETIDAANEDALEFVSQLTVEGSTSLSNADKIADLDLDNVSIESVLATIRSLQFASSKAVAITEEFTTNEIATVTQLKSIFARVSGKLDSIDVTDSGTNVATLTADQADTLDAVVINGEVSVAQYQRLVDLLEGNGSVTSTIVLSDTLENLTSTEGLANLATNLSVASVKVSGAISIEELAEVKLSTSLSVAYTLSDTAETLAEASNNAAIADASNVIVEDAATASEIVSILAQNASATYSLEDSAAALASSVNLNAATNITVIGDASIANALIINAATNSGSTTLGGLVDTVDAFEAKEDLDATDSANDAAIAAYKAILAAASSVTVSDVIAELLPELSAANSNVTDGRTIEVVDSLATVVSTFPEAASGDQAVRAAAFAKVDAIILNDISAFDIAITSVKDDIQAVLNYIADNKGTNDFTFEYAVTGSLSELQQAGPTVFNATSIDVEGVISVAEFNGIAFGSKAIAKDRSALDFDIVDTAANLLATSAATATTNANSVLLVAKTGANAADYVMTVAQAESLAAILSTATANTVSDISDIVIADTAAAIQAVAAPAMGAVDLLAAVDSVTLTDNGALTTTADRAALIFDVAVGGTTVNDGSDYADYSLVDTAAEILDPSAAMVVKTASAITVTDTVTTIAEAVSLADLTSVAEASFALELAADTIFDDSDPVGFEVDAAKAVSAADSLVIGTRDGDNVLTIAAISEAEALLLNGADVDLSAVSYSLMATTPLTTKVDGVISLINDTSIYLNAQSITLATATVADIEALVDAGVELSAISFSLTDSAANLAAADSGILEASGSITASDVATVEQAEVIVAGYTPSTMTTLTVSITDTAAAFTAASEEVIFAANGLTVTGEFKADEAISFIQARTDEVAGFKVATFSVTDTAQALESVDGSILDVTGATITATTPVTMALAGIVDGKYTISDSFTAIMVNEGATGPIDEKAFVDNAQSIEVTDTLTVAQFIKLAAATANINITYSIVDSDEVIANIANKSVLEGAESVQAANGVIVAFETVASDLTVFGLTGSIEELSGYSDELKAANLIYQVSQQELADNADFFGTREGNEYIMLVDTAAALLNSNTLTSEATKIVVTDSIKTAQIADLTALAANDHIEFSVVDTIAELTKADNASAISALTTGATVSFTVTDVADASEAVDLAALPGTVSFDVADTLENLDGGLAALDDATNITVALDSTTPVAATAAQVEDIFAAANTGKTVIAAASMSIAEALALDDVATSGVLVDPAGERVITKLAISDDISVDQALELLAAPFDAVFGEVSYSLVDTAAKLAEATDVVLANVTSIDVSDDLVDLALAAKLDGAPATNANTTYSIADTAANILDADRAALERGEGANNTVLVTDAVSVATAAELIALDNQIDLVGNNADAGIFIQGVDATSAGEFAITDSAVNLTAQGAANIVADATAITVTDSTITYAQALAVETAATSATSVVFSVKDSFAELSNGLTTTPISAEITGTITVADITTADNFGTKVSYAVKDTAANLASDADALIDNDNITTLTVDGVVSDLTALDALFDLKAEYGIQVDIVADHAAVIAQLNGVDRTLLDKADSIKLSGSISVAEALGSDGAGSDAGETRGVYRIESENLVFDVADTQAEIKAAIGGLDQQGLLDGATVTVVSADNTADVDDTIDLVELDALGRGFIVNAGLGDDTIKLGANADTVELAADDSLGFDSISGFDKSADVIDLLLNADNSDSAVIGGAADSSFGELAANGVIADALTATGVTVTAQSANVFSDQSDVTISDADVAAALQGVSFSANEDVAYLLLNTDTNSVLLVRVDDNVNLDQTIQADEVTQLATFTAEGGLTVADLSASNFTDFS